MILLWLFYLLTPSAELEKKKAVFPWASLAKEKRLKTEGLGQENKNKQQKGKKKNLCFFWSNNVKPACFFRFRYYVNCNQTEAGSETHNKTRVI